MVLRRCHLKIHLFLGSGAKRLVQFSREHYEEHSCGIILNLDQWLRKRCLTIFLLALTANLFSEVEQFCAILVEGMMRNMSVKVY